MTSTFESVVAPITTETSIDWYKQQLAASGISDAVANHAGFRLLARQPYNGFEMPYFNIRGEQTDVSTFRRHIPDSVLESYERAKSLAIENGTERPEKPAKCIRIKGVGSGLELPYWPRYMGVDHEKNMQDISTGILITEGEKKALCAQGKMLQEGLPFSCVALNGVGKWRYFIDHFRHFGYCASANGRTIRRPIIIALDWNKENPDVQRAEDNLYDYFASTGAVVTILRWPVDASAGEQKLDDYIVAGGNIMKAIEHSVSLDLNPMNRRYFSTNYAKFEGGIIRLSDAKLFTTAQFTNQYSHLNSLVTSKSGRHSRIYHAKEWLDHQYVPTITGTFFTPWGINTPHDTPHIEGTRLNLFNGWGEAPKEGDVTPWLNHLEHVFPDPKHREWVTKWIGHLIQKPEELCSTYLALSSVAQGTGKGLFTNTLRLMLGDKYCVSGTKEAWTGRFNGEWEGKLLVLTDELLMDKLEERRRMGEKVKSMVGNPRIALESKGVQPGDSDNHLRFIFTANSEKIAHLDPLDRRAACFAADKVLEDSKGDDYARWLRSPGVRSALLHWAGTLDLYGWDSGAPAIKTEARAASISTTLGSLGSFIEDILADVALPGKDIATPDEIAAAYEYCTGIKWSSGKASLCSMLSRHNVISTRVDELRGCAVPIYRVDGANLRLWLIRNHDRYRAMTSEEFIHSYKRQASGAKY